MLAPRQPRGAELADDLGGVRHPVLRQVQLLRGVAPDEAQAVVRVGQVHPRGSRARKGGRAAGVSVAFPLFSHDGGRRSAFFTYIVEKNRIQMLRKEKSTTFAAQIQLLTIKRRKCFK